LDGFTNSFTRTPEARWALPSYDEWHKAAYYKGGGTHSGYWQYATRSDRIPGWDLFDSQRNNANYRGGGAYPIYTSGGYYTSPVGQFRLSPGSYGTFDMNGNVAEWCEALPLNTTNTTVRGGSYSDPYEALRSLHQPMRSLGTMDAAIGFRVVRLCPADFNNDGTVDVSDYLDFVSAFSENTPAADFNRDSVIDFFDYLDFVRVFYNGC
jgi:formylglycine-generating enzyme required for sulfatase activity